MHLHTEKRTKSLFSKGKEKQEKALFTEPNFKDIPGSILHYLCLE